MGLATALVSPITVATQHPRGTRRALRQVPRAVRKAGEQVGRKVACGTRQAGKSFHWLAS